MVLTLTAGWAHILWLSQMVCILFAASAFFRFCCQCFQPKGINIEPLTPLLRECCPWQHGANYPPPPRVSTSWKDPQAPFPNNNPSCHRRCALETLPYINLNIAHRLHWVTLADYLWPRHTRVTALELLFYVFPSSLKKKKRFKKMVP